VTPEDVRRALGLALDACADPLPAQRYEVGELLGEGGAGRVYAAVDHYLERAVAIKRCDSLVELLGEARTLAALEHPHIMNVMDVAVDDEGWFFVMPQAQSSTLAERLGSGTLVERLGLFLKVCEAMTFAHAQGRIHRDLKPANILVGRFDEVRVADWGLSRSVSDGDSWEAGRAGTPGWMAPEQLRGEPLGPAADVYALGLVLGSLLNGSPWPAPSLGETRPMPACATELQAVLAWATHPVADQRPTVAALRADIVAYLDGGLVAAADYSSLNLLARFVVRHLGQMALAVGAVGAVLIGATLAAQLNAWQLDEARRRAEAAQDAARRSLGVARLEQASAALRHGDPLTADYLADAARLVPASDLRLRLLQARWGEAWPVDLSSWHGRAPTTTMLLGAGRVATHSEGVLRVHELATGAIGWEGAVARLPRPLRWMDGHLQARGADGAWGPMARGADTDWLRPEPPVELVGRHVVSTGSPPRPVAPLRLRGRYHGDVVVGHPPRKVPNELPDELEVRRVDDWALLFTLPPHPAVVVSPVGDQVCQARDTVVTCFDLAGVERRRIVLGSSPQNLLFSQDGARILAWRQGGHAELVELATGQTTQHLLERSPSLLIDDRVLLVDPKGWRWVALDDEHDPVDADQGALSFMRLSDDGASLVTVSERGARVRDATTLRPWLDVPLMGATAACVDARMVFVGNVTGALLAVPRAEGGPTGAADVGQHIMDVACAGGRATFLARDGTLWHWDPSTSEPEREPTGLVEAWRMSVQGVERHVTARTDESPALRVFDGQAWHSQGPVVAAYGLDRVDDWGAVGIHSGGPWVWGPEGEWRGDLATTVLDVSIDPQRGFVASATLTGEVVWFDLHGNEVHTDVVSDAPAVALVAHEDHLVVATGGALVRLALPSAATSRPQRE